MGDRHRILGAVDKIHLIGDVKPGVPTTMRLKSGCKTSDPIQ